MPLWTYVQPPQFHNPKDPRAVATTEGWVDPVTGEVLVAIGGLTTLDGGTSTLISISFDKQAYVTGNVMTLSFEYNEKVTVTGTPTVAVTIGSNTRTFSYASGSGTGILNFTYTAVSGDAAAAGHVTPVSPISGTIVDTDSSNVSPKTFTSAKFAATVAHTTVN